MKKLIVMIGMIGLIAAAAFATDWSNPHPQSGGDSAGQLVLKHELNMTDLYQASTGKLNYLKGNFSGAAAPSGPNTGQAWYDSTNKLFKIYDSSWGGGGFYSTATSSFTGPIVSSGTNTFSGTQNVTGAIVSSTTNTFSGTQNITGAIVSTGTNTFSGSQKITGLATFTGGIVSTGTMTGNASSLLMTGETSTTSTTSPVTLDLGTVTAGDRVFVSVYANVTNNGTGLAMIQLSTAGCTVTIGHDKTRMDAWIGNDIMTTGSSGIPLSGIIKVTGNGTLTISVAFSQQIATSTLNNIQIYAVFLKKQ